MDWLNYHHLLYFWVAAREGSITKACRLLHLAQPTVSGQIKSLERSLKAKLFDRSGRAIVLTETGRLVFRYADEIFSLGRELREVVHGGGMGRSQRLTVGVADALPKLLVHRLLQPALGMGDEVQVHCIDGEPDRLVAQLALHELDVVISDVPASPQLSVRSFNHLLGECGVTFFGTKAASLRGPAAWIARATSPLPPPVSPVISVVQPTWLTQWIAFSSVRPLSLAESAKNAGGNRQISCQPRTLYL